MGGTLRVLIVIASISALPAMSNDWVLVPGERAGAITKTLGKESLAEVFGDEALLDRPFYIGEGFCVPGAVIFEGTPDEAEIAWRDDEATAVAIVRVMTPGGRWKTTEGIRIGTTLPELESLNGAPFTFGGFGWDYGGGVGGWNGGRLDASLGLERGLGLRLDADNEAVAKLSREAPVDRLFGERSVRSDDPLAQRAGIRVTMVEVRLGPLPEEKFCG